MDYNKYIKDDWTKMALKGIKIPFENKWESALVAARVEFLLNQQMSANALKLIEQISDPFYESFSKGIAIEPTPQSLAQLGIMLNIQDIYEQLSAYLTRNMPPLTEIILPCRQNIDEGIFNYWLGNKKVLDGAVETMKSTIGSIETSAEVCFNKQHVQKSRESMAQLFKKRRDDIKQINNKLCASLSLEGVLQC